MVDYADGSLLSLWYDTWLVLLGFAGTVVLALVLISSQKWTGRGLVMISAVVLAILAEITLAMLRIGLNLSVSNYDTVGYISLVGAAVALAVGLSLVIKPDMLKRLVGRYREAVQKAEDLADASDTTDQAETLAETLLVEDASIPGDEAPPLTDAPGQPLGEEPRATQTAWLHFKTGAMTGQSIPLKPEVTSIGRGEDNDIVMDDASVSRSHALISAQEGQYFIEDQGSSTGTMVEGMTATRTLLTSGATLQLGGAEAVFVQGESTTDLGTESGAGLSRQDPGETIALEQPVSVMAWLAVTEGPDKGKTYQLKVGDNTIGRDPGNDLAIEDSSVSRQHAMIKVKDESFLLVDLGSRGGTKVAGKTLTGKAIESTGVITVGKTRLSLIQVDAGTPPVEPVSSAGQTIVEQPGSGGGAVLIAQSGPDAGKSFPLVQGENLIGRDPDSPVRLSDEGVSRRHALIRQEQDRFIVFDLGSRTGTQIDGEPITGHQLDAGESISLGKVEIMLMQIGQKKG